MTLYQRAQETGTEPNELGLISTHTFSVEQMNSMCNSCHAKMSPITASFKPGERYFDHFDLVALESPDFYPDGRDLGENYTMTTWRASPCVKAGQLDCMHCHTSSGRYRFRDPNKANGACLPCHRARVETVAAHSHHEQGGEGSRCVACHMPMTRFAQMNRTDHSMCPPVPAATIRYHSDNACNLCHQDQDAAWAQRQVAEWGLVTRQQRYRQLPDSYVSHYNLGNIHMDRRDHEKALEAYGMAIKLRPDFVPPYVNIALIHNAMGENDREEASFRKALELEPDNPAVHLNLGMLLGELKRPKEAEQAFRAALAADPNSAPAAYNLGILLMEDPAEEGLRWCRKAFRLRPSEGKYGYTYAFFLHQRGQTARAVAVLEGMVNRQVPHSDAYALLGSIYLRRGDSQKAAEVYRAAQSSTKLAPRDREAFRAMVRRLE